MIDVANKRIVISQGIVIEEQKPFDNRKMNLTGPVTGCQNDITNYGRDFLLLGNIGTNMIEGVTGYEIPVTNWLRQ